jgi:hypothetical protein
MTPTKKASPLASLVVIVGSSLLMWGMLAAIAWLLFSQ